MTLFVARFIGSPPMNTMAVTSVPPTHVEWQQQMLAVPPALAPRPEHVFLQGSRWAQGEAPGQTLAAQVQAVEYAGDQRFLELQVQGTLLLARVEPEFAVERGQTVALWFAPGRLQLFDPASELSLDAQALTT